MPTTEAGLRAECWAVAAAPLPNPRWPRINIEFYTIAVCAPGGGAEEALGQR